MISVQVRYALRAAALLLFILAQVAVRAQSVTPLASFNYSDGGYLYGGVIQASDGNLYGTTYEGGANGYGTVFRMTPSGTLTTLYSFEYTDGRLPVAGLIQASDGNLYGTTDYGGANGYGTVFRMTLSGTLTTLYSFDYYTAGGYPIAGLIQASDGNLYGTTPGGGTYDEGTVFRITLSGTLTALYSFGSSAADGAAPISGLIQASDGNLYGTTEEGGPNNYGTVYRVNLPQTSPVVLTERTVYTNLHPGTVSVVIWATNTGSKNEFNVTINAASLIGVSTSTVLPKNLGTIRPRQTVAVVLSFPGLSVGQTGQLLVSGTSTEEHVSSPLTFFLNRAFTIP